MWVTEDGRTNTVALPDPSYVLSDAAFDSWNELVASVPHDTLRTLLESRFEAVLEQHPHQPDSDDTYFHTAPPAEFVDSDLSTIDRLNDALDALETRWYVDVVEALRDLLIFPDRVQYESSD